VDGNLNYNVTGGGGTGTLTISSLVCADFFHGDPLPTVPSISGNVVLTNADMNNLTINTLGTVNICNFRLTGQLDVQNCLNGNYNSGSILGVFRVRADILNNRFNALEILSDVTIESTSCSYGNLICFSNPGGATPVTYFGMTISGNSNTFNNIQTHNPGTPGGRAGGTLSVSGNDNVLDSFNLMGSSCIVSGVSNHLQNFKVRGCLLEVRSPGTQQFLITGLQTKLSNIHLGSSLISTVGATFTTDGYGSNVDGSYNIQFGNPTAKSLQVSNFSFYPRRGQPGGPSQDITGALGAQTFSIESSASIYSNMRIWSYPGDGAGTIGHQTSAQTLNITTDCTFSQFDSILVGYCNETNTAVGIVGIYTCNGDNNIHKNINSFAFNSISVGNQFIGCVNRGGATTINNVATTICVGNRGFAGIGATTGQSAPIPINSNT
jgi:hypothetical protein